MENFKNIDPLDDWLKSMKDATTEPAPEVWESLSGRIPAKPRKSRLGFWWLSLLGLALVVSGYLFLNSNEKLETSTKEELPIFETKINEASEPNIPVASLNEIHAISNTSSQKSNERNHSTLSITSKPSISKKLRPPLANQHEVKIENPLKENGSGISKVPNNSKELVEKIKSEFYQKHINNLNQIQKAELKKLPSLHVILAYNSGTPKSTLSKHKTSNIFPLLSIDAGVKLNHFPIHKVLEIDDKNAINSGNPIQTSEMGIQMNFEINPKWMVSWNIISRKNLHFEIINQAAFEYIREDMETDLRGKMTGEFDHDLGALELRSSLTQKAGTYYPEGDLMHTEFKIVGDWRYKKSSFFVYRRIHQNKTKLAFKLGVGLNTLQQSKVQASAVRYFDNRISNAHMNIMLRDLKKRYVDGTFGLDIEKPIFRFLSLVVAPEVNVALSPILNNHSNIGFGIYGGLRYRIR